ncbi:ArsR/SmtB family transcription factor [Amycolatopsis plumensis]|uniref:ArsR/SmtB family transcription factor n=2 Tax=Amycolatopsis plumensis TaxID=236508 RepID=A0ABV5UIG4_9PSEU
MKMLTTLARPTGYSPDFLTPPTTTPDLHSALDALAHTDPVEIRADIDRLATEAALPPWAHAISDENSNVLELLVDNILQYYSVALQPYWPVIRTQVQASWMQVAETILLGGTEKAIGSLFPDSLWRDQILHVSYPEEHEIGLDGRGLILIPSFFCWRTPITLANPRSTPVLVYPVAHDPSWLSTGARQPMTPSYLEKLIGRTRAIILSTIGAHAGMNTTEVAAAVYTSLASASQHTTVLREAGLITTAREPAGAIHRLTRLGASLLTEEKARFQQDARTA